ncbi:lactate dehydrogenase [Prochlorococcus sp. AH-716-K03]|nr:lactate dehydrogenase [Prochlorococcus sp. AH-716-K03]|tara:strand:+ start:633 stop:875 length:243 start_codon:yes stop_codon:yes gene_type:complete
MKNLRITIIVIFLSIVSLISFKTYRDFIISSDLKNEEKNKLNKLAEVLNECFDLKNKSNRTINDSMKLIEYCLNEFGYEK